MGMRIAMLGTRGLPATYGGVEHHVEEVGRRLVERGHQVTVYSQSHYGAGQAGTQHLGMDVVKVPSMPMRSLEAITHSALSSMAALARGHDVMHYHAIGPGLLAPLPRVFSRTAIVQTIHGLDADRDKWGRGARTLLQLGTWMSARVPHRTLTVSAALRDHYAERYRRSCDYIPNGTSPHEHRPASLIENRHGLTTSGYLLYVGRLVPEKRPDLLIRAFADVETDRRLVIVGGSSYTDEYVERLQELAGRDERVLLTGYAYGEELDELFSNAALFVQPSSLEGLPLTLLEAIGSELPLVVSDIPPHLEIVGTSRRGAQIFRTDDRSALTRAITDALADLGAQSHGASQIARDVLPRFDWERCTDLVEQVYRDVVRGQGTPTLPRHRESVPSPGRVAV